MFNVINLKTIIQFTVGYVVFYEVLVGCILIWVIVKALELSQLYFCSFLRKKMLFGSFVL